MRLPTHSEIKATITNLSKDGAYIRIVDPPPIGTRLAFTMRLPTIQKRSIRVGGKVVRIDQRGMGVLFEDLQSRDRFKIREYATFVDMDDAVVSVQDAMRDVLTGNLLPINDWELIDERLRTAEQFVERTTTKSSTGGEPYAVIRSGGVEPSSDWLTRELKRFRGDGGDRWATC